MDRNRRSMTSIRLEVSTESIKRYQDTLKTREPGSNEYCEAKLALEWAIPEWIARQEWKIANDIKFIERISTAINGNWTEVMDNIKKEVKNEIRS